jgi:succinoglycan biosynthesis transport protein ExoP
MNLKEISYSMKKWLRILALGLILGLAAGYLGIRLQKPVYQATAKILVESSQQTSIADLISLSNQELVQTYIELLKTKPIIDAASAKLGFVIDPLEVSVVLGSSNQIIHIIVEDNNSQKAAQIANTLIQVLVDQNNAAQSNQYSNYETALNDQIEAIQEQITSFQGQIQQINEESIQVQLTQVNGQITQLKSEIAILEQEIARFPINLTSDERASLAEKEFLLEQNKSLLSVYQQIQTNLTYIGKPAQITATRNDTRIAGAQLTLDLYQQLYISLMDNLQNLQLVRFQNTPSLTQIDPAVPPVEPIRPKPLLYLILAGMAGMIMAFGGILLMSYFDNTLKFSNDTEELLGLCVLGTIPFQRQPKDGPLEAKHLIMRDSQGFRKLVAILGLTNREKPFQTLMVTSSEPAEGKTTIAANLASAYSQQGKRVLLIDANFCNPNLHSLLGLNNEQGFAEILNGSKDIIPQPFHYGDDIGFMVLPAGVPNRPDELYQFEKVTRILKKLQNNMDYIIIDSPPMSDANANILAAQTDGVLLVIQSGRTKISSAIGSIQQLKRQGAPILGIVINRSPEGQ